MKKDSIGFRVTPEMKAELEAAAQEDHRTVASLLEKLIADYLKTRKHGGAHG
jgi:predicted transcriptional regulator